MEQFFLFCAAVGGTVLVCQFLLTLIGLGGDSLEVAHDVPHDFSGDMGHMGLDGGHSAGDAHSGDAHAHSSTWIFSIVSFRTVVAALTFFGLSGFAALQGGQASTTALMIGLICGGTAMYGVHYLMRLMYGLSQDRTLRIEHAVGKRGTVYLPIPAHHGGEGKVQIDLQDRLVEYVAATSEPEELHAGTRIIVTRVIGPSTVEVEPVREPVETATAGAS